MSLENIFLHLKEALGFFAFTMLELMVLFVGISFLVGVIQEFVPPEKIKHLLSKRQGRGYFIGAGLGALTPFCSCSTIPIMLGLLKAQAGFGPTLAFLFTSPLVNPIIIGLFFVTFGLKGTLVYSILALTMAIFLGYFLEKLHFERFIKQDTLAQNDNLKYACETQSAQPSPITLEPAMACCSAEVEPQSQACCGPSPFNSAIETQKTKPWARIFMQSVRQFKSFLPYIALGVALGAFTHGFVPQEIIIKYAGVNNPLAVPIAAVIGVPLYIRVSTIIPIAMALMAKGMSAGAVVALAIGGAGASIPEVVMLKKIFKWPLLTAFLGAVFFIAVMSGLVFNAIF